MIRTGSNNGQPEALVRLDREVISEEGGYTRTAWLYAWTGEPREDYRIRVIIG